MDSETKTTIQQSVIASNDKKADGSIKEPNSIYDVNDEKLVAEIPNSKIKLYFVKDDKDFGRYEGFILQINDMNKYFRWEHVNSNREPELILSDLDNDGKDELVVILTKGYGTGVSDREVHVIRLETLNKILVENPLIPLHKNVYIEKTKEQIKVVLNNKTTVLSKKKIISTPYEELGAAYGHYVKFEVNNNVLSAIVPLGVGVNSGIGEFVVKYKYENEILQVESIDFTAVPEYVDKN
jgi:uncharacterized protein (UPF0248 family)